MEILIVVLNFKTTLAPCNLTFTFSFFLFSFLKAHNKTLLKCFASAASNHGLNDIQMYYNIKTLHLFSNYS